MTADDLDDRRPVKGKNRNPGKRLIQGLEGYRDALRDGEPERFTMRTIELVLQPREYSAEDVLRVRERLRTSQGVFAKLIGVSVKTIQAWEQGGNPPPPIARRLLDTIERDPTSWEEMLREAASLR